MSGNMFKQRREALGFTLRDVERITDGEISNSYLSQFENGKIKSPSAFVVLQLCAAYDVSYADALAWLGIKTEIIPPKTCGECGQALPLRYLIDREKRCFTYCGDDNCDCELRPALATSEPE